MAKSSKAMQASLATVRSRVHDKSHDYFVFQIGRWDKAKRNMFYGATDAIYDADLAAQSYESVIGKNVGANLLACYGFLQALYIQQDAVRILSEALGIQWNPNDNARLKEIREVRNRLTGHPAWAQKLKPKSSSVIPSHSIEKARFVGAVYSESGFKEVVINVPLYLADNEAHLVEQMKKVEREMDSRERKFRSERARPLLSNTLGKPFDYQFRKLWCDLENQDAITLAKSHTEMVRKTMESLQEDLRSRELCSETMAFCFDRIFRGLQLLEEKMNKKSFSENDRCDFDLVYDGVDVQIGKLKNILCDLDKKLRTRV